MKKIAGIVLVLAMALAVGGGAGLEQAWAAKAQTTCPVMGGNTDKNVYADYQGKRVYFCCTACIAEFNKDPEKYLKKLADAGVTPEASPQAAEKPPAAQPPAQK